MDPNRSTTAKGGPTSDEGSPLLRMVALALAVFAVLSVVPRWLGWNTPRLVGREAPDFQLAVAANGGDRTTLGIRDLRGRAVVLDFWATWCEPCRMEAPIVQDIAKRWEARGVTVVGVNMDTPDQGDPRAFAMSRGLTYPIVRDPASEASHRYGVDTLPTVVVVSRTGQVVGVKVGLTDDREIERLIERAL
jgi:cytochrome c biogenesis protein CcmG/thiol:disulfide interchange protein DsbE